MSKEMFIDAWEKLYQGALDDGLPEKMAEQIANEGAYGLMRENLADMTDIERLRRKEGR